MKTIYCCLAGIFLLAPFGVFSQTPDFQTSEEIADLFRPLPVLDRGRVKPFGTFTKESAEFIWGRAKVKDQSSIHVVLTWILLPKVWNETEFILVRSANVKKALNLDPAQDHFSPLELFQNENFIREVSELKSRQKRKEKLNEYFKEIQKVESRVQLYQAIREGYLPLWAPEKEGSGAWLSARGLTGGKKSQFSNLLKEYSKAMSSSQTQDLKKAIQDFAPSLSEKTNSKVKAELIYNNLKPFQWGWILYLLAFGAFFLKPRKWKQIIFFTLLVSAFFIHSYGIFLRSYIMSRPPVSNMFETVLWVPWAALVLSFIFFMMKRSFFPLLAGVFGSFLGLFTAESAHGILGGGLEPLEAVLRSNFWLSTHVLIITLSYSAFLLAFIMADVLAFQFLSGKKETALAGGLWFLKRLIQIGVLLLALGTILGGIWADYSWGRFWGWDPKEVWALVSLLGYLALLHARLQGWVKGFGLVLGSIFCFFLIVMAWYGVNFVLGQGLHSYGFGSGGLHYVLGFLFLHLLFIFVVWRRRKT